jgi:hypothetical protein
MTRETLAPGHPTGMYRERFEELARQKGIARGFPVPRQIEKEDTEKPFEGDSET